MSGLEIALFIVFLIISYSIYKAIEKMTESYTKLGEQVNQSLTSIKYSVDNLAATADTEVLDSLLKIPTDIDELNKRKEVLKKCYANYLSHELLLWHEKPSNEDAEIRADFLIEKFGIKDTFRLIDWSQALKNKDAEKRFLATDFFKKEINNFWTVGAKDKKYINPLDLFRPIYAFIKNNDYKDGESVTLNKGEDSDYYSYMQGRAILYNLKNIGIIKFSGNVQLGNLHELPFKFMSADLDVIRKTINDHYSSSGYSHFLLENNKEFDDWLTKHKWELFIKVR